MQIKSFDVGRHDKLNPLVTNLIRFRRRPVYRAFLRTGLLFVHVPRTGGTSICEVIYGKPVNHLTLREHQVTAPVNVLRLPRFAIVRNPWERLVSSWSFARAGVGVDNLVGVKNHERYQRAEFQTFERFVLEWLPAQDPKELDPIFRPQTDFLAEKDGTVALDHLGRLEFLDRTADWIGHKLGRRPSFSHRNASVHDDYRGYYTNRIRRAVDALYGADIEALDYAF